MSNVYTGYFQKSKVFLYPLLGINKIAHYVPIKTYVIWEDLYEADDRRLICEYKNDGTFKYTSFERRVLSPHPYLDEVINNTERSIYVFDLKDYPNDYDNFIKGKYSNFSIESKEKIISYFRGSKISKYIDGYLNPEQYHEEYSDMLGIPLEHLREVYELCSKPDFEKETFKQ